LVYDQPVIPQDESANMTNPIKLAVCLFVWIFVQKAFPQGYIVPNGVVTNLYAGEIDVVWPQAISLNGFSLTAVGRQQPTFYSNVFNFNEPATVGVRVFLVASNDAISLQPIMAQSFSELALSANYIFNAGTPFYVGLYSGTYFATPPNGISPNYYTDPVFGWAKLVNNSGTIQLLDGALAYGSGGIYAGTQNIIPLPEPGTLGLGALGLLCYGFHRWRKK
jgi:hypothetical protein